MDPFSDREIALYQQYTYECEETGGSSQRLTRHQHQRLELWKSTLSENTSKRKVKAPAKTKPALASKTQEGKKPAQARGREEESGKRTRDQEEQAVPSKRAQRVDSRRDSVVAIESIVPATKFSFPLQISPGDLLILEEPLLGEGRIGRVIKAKYGNLLVACKTRRKSQPLISFERQLARELEFAALLSVCRSINQYIGVLSCKRSEIVYSKKKRSRSGELIEHFAVQRYYRHGNLIDYVGNKGGWMHPLEIAQIGTNLFSAITDAHALGIGIVDIKCENVLVDNAGSVVLTDFGSCVRMDGATAIDLDQVPDGVYWTEDVAAPEMVGKREFRLASDVFMGLIIIVELIMSPMCTAEIQQNVLQRRTKGGLISFQPDKIPQPFHVFRPLLAKGFVNDPTQRPTAEKVLHFLETMRQDSFKVCIQQMRMASNYDSLPSPVDKEIDECLDDERSPLSSASSTPSPSEMFSELSWEDLSVGRTEGVPKGLSDNSDEYFDARASSYISSSEDGQVPHVSIQTDTVDVIKNPFAKVYSTTRNVHKYKSNRSSRRNIE